jgi:HK97 family phage portal protein
MFKNMEICLHDIKTGEKIEDHPVLKLLANPNPLQNREQWLTQLSIQRDIWTQAFIYQLRPIQIMKGAAPLPAVLWNLPPNQIEINRTGKMWDQTKLDGIITNYKLLDGSNKTFTPEEVIQISDHTGESYITGESKIISMRTVISNLDGALKTRNCIINDRGALGILSNATKDGDGGLPIDAKERERIEREYRTKYGLSDGQMKLMITNASLNWQPMSYPTKELALFEEVEEDFGGLCGTFGLARDIFPSTQGATFENQVEAFKQTYQNTLQPQADQLMRTLNNRWGLYQQGIELRAEYAWLPVMKEDELKNQQAELAKAQTQSQLLRDGVINKEQYAQAFGITVEDVDASLAQAAGLANAQTQLRGTVGGLTGIISLNAAVGQRQMTREAAVNTLVNYYGYEQSIAESMITDTTNEPPVQSTQNTGTENQPA